jgi:hypothetical protein
MEMNKDDKLQDYNLYTNILIKYMVQQNKKD